MSNDQGGNDDSTVRSVVRIPLQKIAAKVLRSEESTSSQADSVSDESAKTTNEDTEQTEAFTGSRWELLSSLLESGDRAKSNVIKIIGREIRLAVEALELHKDVLSLLQNHSLEIHASLHLKPLSESSGQSPANTDDHIVDNHVDEHNDADLD